MYTKNVVLLALMNSLLIAATSHAIYENEIMQAIESQNTTNAQSLIDKGADVNALDSEQTPILIRAVMRGDPEMVRLLISHNADLSSLNSQGRTPLMIAAASNNDAVARVIKDALNSYFIDALIKRDINATEKWLKQGADPNSTDNAGTPAIILATDNNELTKLIASHRPEDNAKDNEAHMATDLVPSPASDTMTVIRNSPLEINAKNKAGSTALTIAALKGQSDVVKTLLDHDADPMIKDAADKSPLNIAVAKRDLQVVKTLLAEPHGSKITFQEKRDALRNAQSNQFDEITEELQAAGARRLSPGEFEQLQNHNGDRQKELIEAIKANNADLVGRLVDAINPNEQIQAPRDEMVSGDWTPLMYAASRGNIPVVEVLLSRRDIKTDVRDRQGRTALDYARRHGHKAIIDLLTRRQRGITSGIRVTQIPPKNQVAPEKRQVTKQAIPPSP